ncbi:class I SAM-dependent methyltransferase [Candidatus Hydrogenedentota bacterium]
MAKKVVLNEQVAYYRARAAEYDEWHLRMGRYDRGAEHKERWFSELGAVQSALDEARPLGECLELACGTGLWTPQLAGRASTLTAIDAVPETIEINRTKIGSASVRYVVADLFEWWPTEKYDFVFFGFWLSHVPQQRFNRFWEMVRAALKPGGRVFFVDSLEIQESTARNHAPINDSGIVERKLNDQRTFNIVKVFHDPDKLKRQLEGLDWAGNIQTTGKFFYYGCMAPKAIC